MERGTLRTLFAVLAGFVLAALWIWLGPLALSWMGLTGGDGAGETLFTIAIFGPMLAAALLGGWLTGVRTLRAGERRGAWRTWGAILGAAGILIAVGYAWIAGTLVSGDVAGTRTLLPLAGCAVVLLQVLAEEAYFRGWLQPLLIRALGDVPAVVVTAFGFALLHLLGGARDPLSLANLFLGGLLFGVLAWAGASIWPAVAAHFMWNAIEQLALGLDPNPGLGGFGALANLDLVGASAWGGSGDGLNASIGMAFALLAMLTPLIILQWKTSPKRTARV